LHFKVLLTVSSEYKSFFSIYDQKNPHELFNVTQQATENYRVQKSPLPVIIPIFINPDDAFPSYAFKIHFIVIL
jgi:hypothetical protein